MLRRPIIDTGSRHSSCLSSVAILAQAITCSNVRGVFPVHERFSFCLVQVSTTQVCRFSSISPARVFLRIGVLLTVFHDLDEK